MYFIRLLPFIRFMFDLIGCLLLLLEVPHHFMLGTEPVHHSICNLNLFVGNTIHVTLIKKMFPLHVCQRMLW